MTVEECLAKMLEADQALFGKILDTPGFAFYFNELVKLAQRDRAPKRFRAQSLSDRIEVITPRGEVVCVPLPASPDAARIIRDVGELVDAANAAGRAEAST